MTSILSAVHRFLREEDGPTAVEYAVMLSMIVMVCITAIGAIGQNTATHFQEAADGLS